MADKSLNLYRGLAAVPPAGTWVTLFTTNPTQDHPTDHSAVEWGPPRVRVYPNTGAGAPFWSAPADLTIFERSISNLGALQWLTIALTVSPSAMIGVGVFDAATGGNLLTWYPLDAIDVFTRADGETVVFGTNTVSITAD